MRKPDGATDTKGATEPDDGRPDVCYVRFVRCLIDIDGEERDDGYDTGQEQDDKQFLGHRKLPFFDQDDKQTHKPERRHQILRVGDREEPVGDREVEAAYQKSGYQYFEPLDHRRNVGLIYKFKQDS